MRLGRRGAWRARARYPSANAPSTCGTTCPLRWVQRRPSSSRDRAGGRRAEAFGVGTASSRAVASSAVAALDDDAAGFAGGADGRGRRLRGRSGLLIPLFLLRPLRADVRRRAPRLLRRTRARGGSRSVAVQSHHRQQLPVNGTSGAMSTMSLNFFLLFDGAGMMNRCLSRRAGCPGDGPWRVGARPAARRYHVMQSPTGADQFGSWGVGDLSSSFLSKVTGPTTFLAC